MVIVVNTENCPCGHHLKEHHSIPTLTGMMCKEVGCYCTAYNKYVHGLMCKEDAGRLPACPFCLEYAEQHPEERTGAIARRDERVREHGGTPSDNISEAQRQIWEWEGGLGMD